MEFFAKGMQENKDTIAAGMAVDVVGKSLVPTIALIHIGAPTCTLASTLRVLTLTYV